MKWIKRILVAVVVLLVVVGVVTSFFLGSFIKTAAETAGPKVLGVDVKLERAQVYPLRGKASLKGLLIGNPEGFKADSMFELGEVSVDMKVGSLLTDRIIIDRIYIDAPKITYEQALTGNNIGRLLEGLDSGEQDAEPAREEPAAQDEAQESGKQVQINEFVMENAQIAVALTAAGGKGVTLTMPTLRKEGIGAEREGMSPEDVTREVVAMVSRGIIEVVKSSGGLLGKGAEKMGEFADSGLEKAGELMGKGAEGAGEALASGADRAGEVAGEAAGKGAEAVGAAAGKAGEALGSGAEKLKEGLGGLFHKGQ